MDKIKCGDKLFSNTLLTFLRVTQNETPNHRRVKKGLQASAFGLPNPLKPKIADFRWPFASRFIKTEYSQF